MTVRVDERDLASTLGGPEHGGPFPPVYATSRMVALMELAAAKCLLPLLEPMEVSVGVDVQVRHLAATPPGVQVTASARFSRMNGKLYEFEVFATDPAGEIGRGLHSRAIVDSSRLESGAARRRSSSSGS
jgi:predicted thioesterase